MTDLARLLDPAELDAATGPHGRLTIELATARLGEPVEILVPSRLACGRCEGGGCDACGRSGAVMLDRPEAERKTRVVLPKDASDRLRVRLVRPLGDEAGLEQLTLDVHLLAEPAAAESEALTTLGTTAMTAGGSGNAQPLRSIVVAALLALAAALAIAASIR